MGIQNIQSMYADCLWGMNALEPLSQGIPNYAHGAQGLSFQQALSEVQQEIERPQEIDTETYKNYLEKKFGVRVTAKYFKNDQESLDVLGRSMNGNDVVVAPNILEQMVTNREKANYYEEKIQYYFDNIPKWQAESSAMGLTYEPCGVAIHEDGTVYYIGGCTETPERKAKIIAAQKAKEEKKLKHWLEQKEYNQWLVEHKQIVAKTIMYDMQTKQQLLLPAVSNMPAMSIPTTSSLPSIISGSITGIWS